jgi:hypothetical protein
MRRPLGGGFTSLELLALIGRTGLLMLMCIPTMTGYLRSGSLVGTARTLEADLRHARSLASAPHRTYQTVTSPAGDSLVCLAPAATLLTRTLPEGMTCRALNSAAFLASGLAHPASITLRLGTRSSTVRVNAAGGITRE